MSIITSHHIASIEMQKMQNNNLGLSNVSPLLILAMTLGSTRRKASLHRQTTSDALLLLPKSATLSSLNQSRDNGVFVDYPAHNVMSYGETECMLVKREPKTSTGSNTLTIHNSVVMERRRTIGAKVSNDMLVDVASKILMRDLSLHSLYKTHHTNMYYNSYGSNF